jgi:hypothetical protein
MEYRGSSVIILGGCHGRVVAVGFKTGLAYWVFVGRHGGDGYREGKDGKRDKVTTEGEAVRL